MRKRESHTKSRNGCSNCKRRHVKCDEQGPPCANCIARKIDSTCTLPNVPNTSSILPTPPDTSSVTTNGESNQISIPGLDTSDSARRLLELELMARWCTTTYKSLYCVPEDIKYLQINVPQGALKHPFLLHGIFSIAALDIAMCEKDVDSSVYACAALEHYDKSSEAFREELGNVTPENHHYLVFFSVMAAAINLAIPQSIRAGEENPQSTMLERMVVLFDLLLASTSLASMNWILLFESPFGRSMFSALSLMEQTPLDPLSEATETAFKGLYTLAESMGKDEEILSQASVFINSYPNAIRYLKYLFMHDDKDAIKGFFSAFPSLAGQDYIIAVKSYEPMALFIMMYWGVLLDRQATKFWWAVEVGKKVVAEVSDVVSRVDTNLARMPEWKDGISWARESVGLEVVKDEGVLSILG